MKSSTVPNSQTGQFCFVNWRFHCIIFKIIETLILNVNMASSKQLSRPEKLPGPFEKQVPEQGFWSQTHICSPSNSIRKEPDKGSPLKINISLCVLKEVTEWITESPLISSNSWPLEQNKQYLPSLWCIFFFQLS